MQCAYRDEVADSQQDVANGEQLSSFEKRQEKVGLLDDFVDCCVFTFS